MAAPTYSDIFGSAVAGAIQSIPDADLAASLSALPTGAYMTGFPSDFVASLQYSAADAAILKANPESLLLAFLHRPSLMANLDANGILAGGSRQAPTDWNFWLNPSSWSKYIDGSRSGKLCYQATIYLWQQAPPALGFYPNARAVL